jgi:hypothetical protein
LGESRHVWVGYENVTPIAARTAQLFLLSVARRQVAPERRFCNQDFDAKTPKRDRLESTYQYTRRQLPTANLHLRTSSASA